MDDPQTQHNEPSAPRGDRLHSWKKIASYLKRDVSTVQRWERREAMPIHRHQHDKRGSVFAFRGELDAWWESRRKTLASEEVVGSRPLARSLLPKMAVAAAVVLVAAIAWFATSSNNSWRNPLANARFTRLEDLGTERAATISRDGRRVAFLADRDGQIDVWLSELDRGNYRNLTRGALRGLTTVNPSIRALGFSADSSLLSVWTRRPDGSHPDDVSVLAVPTAGGPLRPYLPNAAEFDWSRDGTRLVYHTTAPGDPLFVREPPGSRAGGDRTIYTAAAGVHCHFPIWSPDDAYIYFVRGVPPDDWDIWRIRPSGGDPERITAQNARIAYPVMLDRRTLLYLATDANGFGPWIYGVDVERRLPHRISNGLESYTSLASSADGMRLVATIANPHTSLWRVPLIEDRADRDAEVAPTAVTANGVSPRMAVDSIVYIASRAGRQGIWALTGGKERELWGKVGARIVGGPAVAPSGRSIAFTVADDDKTLLYVVDPQRADAKVIVSTLALRGNPAWTPDGTALVVAVVENGEPRLTRISLNGEPPRSLVSEYSVNAVWSPDGHFFVYSGADVGTMFPLRAAAADGRAYPLPSLMLARGSRIAFSPDPHTLVVLRGEPGHMSFWLADLATGTQRLSTELPADFVTHDFDVSRNGMEIVFDRVEENSDIALIERTL